MQLAIYLGDVLVGTLERSDDLRTSLRFADEYVAVARRPVLGQFFVDKLRRPIEPEPQLPAFFANLLPEGRLRALIVSAIGMREHHDFRLLAHLGRDLPGAIRVSAVDAGGAPEAAEPADAPRRGLGSRLRVSLAAVQLKVSVLQADWELALPARGQGGNWLLKLPDREHPGLPENEYAVMGWARESGIDVPEFNVFTHAETEGIDRQFFPDGTVALGVRRFDRPAPGERVHIEDFAQVNGVHPFNKYDDMDGALDIKKRLNYETLALQVLRLCGEDDLREFVRRVVFMVLSGNADAHLKNWSLIYPDGRQPRLSPAYDLVATVAYAGHDESLALPFGNSLRFEDVSLEGFRRLGRALRRDPEELARWVAEDTQRIMDCRAVPLRALGHEGRHALDQHHVRLRQAPGSLLYSAHGAAGSA